MARPAWRGRLHVFALATVGPVFIALFVVANGVKARISVVVYALGLLGMFAVSATYHRWVHTMRARELWRRADHATIFAAIAGSCTPICLLALPWGWGLALLIFMWTSCLAGMAIKIAAWRHARIVGGVMYIAVSWVAVAAIPEVWMRFGVFAGVLIIVSGIFYTGGAILLNRQWPKLRPHTFGYHEVWHACTVAAAVCHLGAVWIIVRA